MVRINLINPKRLTDQHLLAEFVEIKMLALFVKKYPRGFIPEKYTLGKGHMSFFRDKMDFVAKRFFYITKELKKRNFNLDEKNINDVYKLFRQIPIENTQDYQATKEAITINKKRILERVKSPIKLKNHTYYGEKIKFKDYLKITS